MTTKQAAHKAATTIAGYGLSRGCTVKTLSEIIEQAVTAAVEEDRRLRPHVFVGSLDRHCEVCGEPDRDERHVYSRESVRASVEFEREACAKLCEAEAETAYIRLYFREAAELIRARSNGGTK